jgi:sucrose-6-phosphate hydrolase SacC (GH32 family)
MTNLIPVSTVPGWVSGGDSRLSASEVTARQFEIQASFDLRPVDSSNNKASTDAALRSKFKLQSPEDFAVGVRTDFGSDAYADAYMRGSVKGNTITSLSLWFDKSQAGGATNTTWLEGGPVPLPADESQAWKVPDQPLELSVWVDHGVIEIFGVKGLGRLSSRVYPEDDSVAWGASVWAIPPESGDGWAAQVDAQAWEMKSAWLAPNC